MLVNTELNDTNISAINVKVIPIAAYSVNVCKFSKGELNTLDRIIKRELRSKQMLGKQASERDLPKKRTWRKRIKINERCMQASKTARGMLHVQVVISVDPNCLEKENIEARKYCYDRSTNNNGRSRPEIKIRGQRNTIGC